MDESDVTGLLTAEPEQAPVPPLVVKLLAWAVLASLAVIPMAGAYFAPIILRLDRDCPALTTEVRDTRGHLREW